MSQEISVPHKITYLLKPLLSFTLLLILLAGTHTLAWTSNDDALILYSGRSDKFVRPAINAFTEKTGIKVILHTASATALLNKLRLEGAQTQADVYMSNDAGNLQIGEDMGLFSDIPEHITALIPANLRSAQHKWLGLSARARVLVVNTHSTEAAFVKSVFDLSDPKLKNKLAITHSHNESFIAGTTVYQLAAGEEKTRQWLQGIKINSAGEVFNKHSKIVTAVANGKKAIGLVNHYYIYRHLDKYPQAPIRIIIPDQGDSDIGLAWNVAGIAISKYSKKKAAAEQLIAFLVSKQGQQLFSEGNREYPTRIGTPSSHIIPPLKDIKIANVPMSKLGLYRNQTLDLIEAVGMP